MQPEKLLHGSRTQIAVGPAMVAKLSSTHLQPMHPRCQVHGGSFKVWEQTPLCKSNYNNIFSIARLQSFLAHIHGFNFVTIEVSVVQQWT